MAGKYIALDVEPSDKIENIKAKIQEKEELPLEEQILFFDKNILENARTLNDYNITDVSILHLILKNSKSMSIFVKTLTGKTITLELEPTGTIDYVK